MRVVVVVVAAAWMIAVVCFLVTLITGVRGLDDGIVMVAGA